MQRQLHRPSAPAAFQCEMSRFCVVFGGRWRQDVSLMTAASPRTPPLLPLNNCYKPLRLLEASRRIKFVAFGLCTGQRQCAACCRSLHSISHRSSCKLGWGVLNQGLQDASAVAVRQPLGTHGALQHSVQLTQACLPWSAPIPPRPAWTGRGQLQTP